MEGTAKLQENSSESDIRCRKPPLFDFHLEKFFEGSKLVSTLDTDDQTVVQVFRGNRKCTEARTTQCTN